MKLTLPKVGTWNPSGLPKTQSSVAGVKTPRTGVFFIPVERSQMEMASHEPFGHLQPKLWAKEGPGVTVNLTPDH